MVERLDIVYIYIYSILDKVARSNRFGKMIQTIVLPWLTEIGGYRSEAV